MLLGSIRATGSTSTGAVLVLYLRYDLSVQVFCSCARLCLNRSRLVVPANRQRALVVVYS
jgi:hypothetical protein